MNPYKNKDLRNYLESFPQDEIDRKTQIQEEETKRIYKEFTKGLKSGKCFICGQKMNSFDKTKPCFHWFTYPNGIKKKYFEKYLEKPIGFFQLDSYFRWLANSENPITNINDLKDETSKTSYLETTIRYKNIEWSFSVGYTDMEGHKDGKVGATPHFHIQMVVNNNIFLKFNDFHIPFSDSDLFNIELLNQASDQIKIEHSYGQGVGILEDENKLKLIADTMVVADNPETAPFNRQTFVHAKEGKTISVEIIQQAIDESNKTKQPIGQILQRLLAESEASILTIITPGDGVPKMTKRSGKK